MAFEEFRDSNEKASLNRERGARLESTPLRRFQVVPVTFASANVDVDIAHTLAPTSPEDICYHVMKQNKAGVVYQDQTVTRIAWTATTVRLRSSVAMDSLIMLFIPSVPVPLLPVRA